MQRRFARSSGRGGFTLIELLVVIAIIAILARVPAPGPFSVLAKPLVRLSARAT